MGARTYPVPTRLIPGVGRPTVTEDALRVIAASGAEAADWADSICARLDARLTADRETPLTAAGIETMPGCDYRGLFDPGTDVPTITHVVRYDPADGAMARWHPTGWQDVPAEHEPVGYDYVELTGDHDLLAQSLEAIGAGGSLVLRATQPRGYLREPGVPLVLTAAGEPPEEGEEQPPPVPAGAKVYAIVDDLDTSAVLDLFFVMPGPAAYRRAASGWQAAPDLLAKLTSVDPPAVVPIDAADLAAVVTQVDDYDRANPPESETASMTAAGTWNETLHPRNSGKFAKKDGGQKATTTGQPSHGDVMAGYVESGGKRPAGVVEDPKAAALRKKTSRQSAAASKRAKGKGGGGAAPGSPGVDPVVEAAQLEVQRQRDGVADEQQADAIKREKANFAEQKRRAAFQTSLGDQLVALLNEGRDERTVEMLLGLRMQAEVARRRKYDADAAENAQAFKIRVMEENLAAQKRQRQISELALKRRHSKRPVTAAGANPPPHTMMPAKLTAYWARGKGAAKIRWGTGGDFNRCRRQLAKYLKPGQLAGACANLHKIATGTWPGKNAHKGGAGKALHAAGDRYPSGVMVALYPPAELASELALPDGEPPEDLHVTLSYHGKVEDLTPEEISSLHYAVSQAASQAGPVSGQIGGYGRFLGSEEEGDPIWLAVDAPDLPKLRETLVSHLESSGVPARADHGFTPHMTLSYVPKGQPGPDSVIEAPVPVDFDSMVLCVGQDQTAYPLGG